MKNILRFFVFVGIIALSSCMGKQNQAPSKGMNLDNERIYGTRGAEPRQLPNKYPEDEDGTIAERVANIQEKLYPTTKTEETSVVVETAADTTASDTTGGN